MYQPAQPLGPYTPAYYAHLLANLENHPEATLLPKVRDIEEALLTYDFELTQENQMELARCWRLIVAVYQRLEMPNEANEAAILADAQTRDA